MMNNNTLTYSTDALNILNQFEEVAFIVYVEGEDDILFWEARFSEHTAERTTFEIIPTGGKDEIYKKVEQVVQNNVRIIIALDRDYSDFESLKLSHARVIRTYGYSIENTMYCPRVLNNIIRKRLRKQQLNKIDAINAWYNDFVSDIEDLLIYDIVMQTKDLSIEVCGDNSARFLKNHGKSPRIDKNKISKKIIEDCCTFSREHIVSTKLSLSKFEKPYRFLVRGHFLTSAVRNIMSEMIGSLGNTSFSNENIYENTVDSCLKKCRCEDYKYLKNSITTAVKSLNLAEKKI